MKYITKKILITCIAMILISTTILWGCSKKVQTVDYYMKHKDELNLVLKSCEVEQGAIVDQNCINAHEALNRNILSEAFKTRTGL